jgi:hypothetical protein
MKRASRCGKPVAAEALKLPYGRRRRRDVSEPAGVEPLPVCEECLDARAARPFVPLSINWT